MRLTRRALHNEIATLEAQLAAAQAEPRVAATVLAENVRLAHLVELLEMDLAQHRAMATLQDVRLQQFMTDHPHLFGGNG